MAQEGLGRVFNVVPTAADTPWISMKNAGGLAFVCVGADTYTISSATDAAGTGPVLLACVTHFYTSSSAAGAQPWVRSPLTGENNAASAVVVPGALGCIQINNTSLPDTADYVRCVSTGAGLVIAIAYDLREQRTPQNLVALAV